MNSIHRKLKHWAVLSALFILPFVPDARAAVPVILVQPVSKSVGTNTTVRFNATVTGSSPFSYRWQFSEGFLTNGSGVSGVTLSNLTIAGVRSYHAGDYRVVITNVDGAVTSAWATLTVTNVPDPGVCTIGLSHYSDLHSADPVTAQVDVIAAAGCTWGLVNTNSWITHVVGVGDSNGFVRYTLAGNSFPAARTGILLIGGNTFTITQLGIINTSSCAIVLSPTSRGHPSGFSTGTVVVTTVPGCFWQVTTTNEWITAPGYTNVGSDVFVYSVLPNPGPASRKGHLLVNDQWFEINQSGNTPPPCGFLLSAVSAQHHSGSSTGSVNVSTSVGCGWNVFTANSWITLLSSPSNSGNGTVVYLLAPNPDNAWRFGIIRIDGHNFSVIQDGISTNTPPECTYALTPTSRGHHSGASTGAVTVATAPGCAWTVVSTNVWIAAPTHTNVGPGSFGYTVFPNPTTSSRTGHLLVGDQWFAVTQSGGTSSPPCSFLLSAYSTEHSSGSSTGFVDVTTAAGCVWNVFSSKSWITLLSSPSNSGSGTVIYLVTPNPGNALRGGHIRIDGQNFLVLQDGVSNPPPCVVEISPTSAMHSANSETGFVSVTVAPGCVWSVVNTNGWITHQLITNLGGFGVRYIVALNTTSFARSGNIRIDDQIFSITQSAVPNTNVTLAEALDTVGTPLVWTSGELSGNWQWFGQTSVTHDGVDAARCAAITQTGASSILKTTVAGPGTLTFWWKTSAKPPYDGLHFFINGNQQAFMGGEADWQQQTFAIPSGSHLLQWMYWHDGGSAGNPGQDCGWVDQIQFVPTSGCSVTLSHGGANHPPSSSTGLVSVAASATCTWSVLNTNFWISIQSGSNGTGNGIVKYVVAANPTPFSRSGTIRIADKLFPITQTGNNTNPPPGCTFVLSPTSANLNAGVSTNLVSVTTSSNCLWLASSSNFWITILSPTTNVGSGTVIYSVAANPTTVTRSGIIRIDGQNFLVTQSGATPPCTVSISPSNRTHAAAAATGTVNVATAPGCTWSVTTTNPWITILSSNNGASNGIPGTAAGTVVYALSANETESTRSGNINIGGRNFLITQSGTGSNTNPPPGCTFVLSPTSGNHGPVVSTNFVSVTTASNCLWLANSTNFWITILSPATNVGSGAVVYRVAANPTAFIRSGSIRIDGQNFIVTQSGGSNTNPPPCIISLSPSNRTHTAVAATGTVEVITASICTWTVTTTNPWITILSSNTTNGVPGTGSGLVVYSISTNDAAAPRSGSINIGGRNFLIVQLGVSTPCTFLLSPVSGTHSAGTSTGLVSVTTQANCSWSAMTTNPWITILFGSNSLGGISSAGSGWVRYVVAPNPSFETRVGSIRIGTANYLVLQHGASNGCFYSIFPGSRSHTSGMATGTVSVTTQTGCAWGVSETNSWITILSSLNNSNSGTVIYRLTPNTNALTRSGIIRIDGHNFFVTQSGTSVPPTNVPPRIQVLSLTTNCTTLSLQGEAGRMYVVECSEDFIHWRPISTNCAPDIFVDPAAGAAQRYYRTMEIR